jgi:DNA-binding HxlR family transcriptional regulator
MTAQHTPTEPPAISGHHGSAPSGISDFDPENSVNHIACATERALELLGDRYSLLIIAALKTHHKLRFVELENAIGGISPRTLSARLKHLERYGLLFREQFPTIPPRVEYSLTHIGESLGQVLTPLQDWADEWFPYEDTTTSTALPARELATV